MQRAQSRKKKRACELRLNIVKLNLVPPGGEWHGESLSKRSKRWTIAAAIIVSINLIVGTSTCKDFNQREIKSHQLFDALENEEGNPMAQSLRALAPCD